MVNLYNYIEIIKMLGISISISIILISYIMYKTYNEEKFLYIFLIYLIEMSIYILAVKYTEKLSYHSSYLISLIYILKPTLFIISSRKIDSNVHLNISIVILSLSSIFLTKKIYIISLIFRILLDLIIVENIIIRKINSTKNILKNKKEKLKRNKKNIYQTNLAINIENNLQNEYKNDIQALNDKIIKSINEVNTPIFLLSQDGKYTYKNKAFEIILESIKYSGTNFNIVEFLKIYFVNSEDGINNIKNARHDKEKSINLTGYNDKVYRFIVISDTINGKSIKICILNDITQSTMIQNKLVESEERYKNLIEILNDGVIIHDMDSVSYINNKAIEIFNLNHKDEYTMYDIKERLYKNFKNKLLKSMTRVYYENQDKSTVKIETESARIIEFITTTINLNNKKMMISLAIDITDLQNAMDELEESEKTYKLLLQTIPEGIAIIDKKSKQHIYRNEAMINLLKTKGWDNLGEIVDICVKENIYDKFKKFKINDKNQSEISVAIIDIKEEDNLLIVVRTLQDEIKIKEMKQTLSQIKEKYKLKTEFLSSVTRDIKNPINIISNAANILESKKDKYNSEDIDRYIKLVRQNSYRLIRLLSNIEQIEEIENGKINMNFDKVNIIAFVKNMVELAKFYTNEKNLKLSFNSNVKEEHIVIDKEKIEKVILNILANAIKFTESGGNISVDINVNNSYIHILIKDNGVGIPRDKIDIIFENFEQVDRTLSRGAEGTGTGLSIAKKLIELHNGKINVYSKIGRGSTFEIILDKNQEFDIENTLYKKQNDFVDKEKMHIEFSDIYLNVN